MLVEICTGERNQRLRNGKIRSVILSISHSAGKCDSVQSFAGLMNIWDAEGTFLETDLYAGKRAFQTKDAGIGSSWMDGWSSSFCLY